LYRVASLFLKNGMNHLAYVSDMFDDSFVFTSDEKDAKVMTRKEAFAARREIDDERVVIEKISNPVYAVGSKKSHGKFV